MGNPFSELGLVDSSRFQVDHSILVSEALEKALCRALSVWSDVTREASFTLHIVGCAAACHLILSGISRVVEAWRSNKSLHN
jgi:hypothetical protein